MTAADALPPAEPEVGPPASTSVAGGWAELAPALAASLSLHEEYTAIEIAASRLSMGSEDWPAQVVLACEDLGIHAVVRRGTVAQALAAVGPEHPVVLRGADGAWVLAHDRVGRRVLVDRPDGAPAWLTWAELEASLDPPPEGELDWVAVDPPSLLRQDGEPSTVPAPPPSPWTRLRTLVRHERHDVAVVLVYAAGVGLLTLATPIAVQALVSTVAFGTLLQPLVILALLLLAGLSFAAVLRALQAWVVEVLQQRLFVRLVNDLSHRLPRVDRAAFDRAHGPELVNRFFDLFTIQKAMSSLLVSALELVLAATVGMLILAFYHPILLAFDVVLLLAVVGILAVLGRGATRSAVDESKAKYEVAFWLQELARHPVAFKLAGGAALARERADRLAAAYLYKRKRHFRIVFRQLAGAFALQALASAGVLGIGGWLVIERQLTLGQLVAAELVVTLVVASLAKVGKYLETTYDLLAALDKVGQLVDLPLEPARPFATLHPSREEGARLAVRALAFAFEGRAPLFEDVDLELAPGERAALLGESGSGRSALLEVLAGLRRPTEGSVELDGAAIEDLEPRALRERVALVRGDEIVAGTLVDNLAFGRTAVDPAQMREVLSALGLWDEVSRLPEGLATHVLPDGSPLSRGGARRVALARAIAGRPSLLLVDGALDGLDPRTRDRVIDALFAPDAPWTLLVVTDDPEVLARCDRTFVLADGTAMQGETS